MQRDKEHRDRKVDLEAHSVTKPTTSTNSKDAAVPTSVMLLVAEFRHR